ncbi:MAG: hypothetical protein UDN37_10315 [Bacteroidales bacterium]|jgi:hypothetical protein|nr:hypothetical protein [Bacteroidales bacterium]
MRTASIIIAVLCFMMALQPGKVQSRYSVFKYSGDVSVCKEKSSTWSGVSKRMSVDPSDVCRVLKGGSLSILDKETSRIFTFDEEGIIDVKALIEKSEAASRNVTARLNSSLASELAKERRPLPTYSVLGATTRDNGDEGFAQVRIPTMTDTVYSVLRQYADSVFAGRAIHSSDSITVEKEMVDEGEFCFMISNRTHSLLYFNILRLNHKTKAVSFSITPLESAAEIFIPGMMYLRLSQYPFAHDQDNEYSYLFFATSNMIDFHALHRMMMDNAQVSDLPANYSSSLQVVSLD